MSIITPADRQQLTFMNSLDDLISQSHPLRLLDELIDKIVDEHPKKFKEKTTGDVGRPKYHSNIFLKLFIYGHINKIQSSRRLENEAQRNIEVL